jgi:hypothetical protein
MIKIVWGQFKELEAKKEKEVMLKFMNIVIANRWKKILNTKGGLAKL